MKESTERISVCAGIMAKCQNKNVRLIGRVIQGGQPGRNTKVQVYAGPGNPVTVTCDIDLRIENLVEFVGTVISPTSMRADSYHVLSGEQADDFDLETYCEAVKFTSSFDTPWTDGLDS